MKMALPDYPHGWFAVAYSTDLQRGQVLQRHLFGRELVLFRTMSGKAVLVDAYCPHLGAHLAHGGRIEGETIRCPFHGFCFNAEGKCVSTQHSSEYLPKATLQTWLLVEHGGFLFTYFNTDEDNSPPWALPLLDELSYTHLKGQCEIIRGHPQEILENSVDFAHLTALHAFDFPPIETQITTDGEKLKVVAALERPGHLFTRKRVRVTYNINMHGLGVSYVNVHISEQDLQLRLYGMATPVDPGTVELRLAVQLRRIAKRSSIHPLLALFPKRWIEALILRQAFHAYVADVSKDIPIWQNKIYIASPAAAQGNGPILQYRKWASQFYS